MKNPKVDLDVAQKLAMNILNLRTLKKALTTTAYATEQALAYSEAINVLLIEKDELIEKCFNQ